MSVDEIIGNRVREIRESKKLTLDELSEALGISTAYLSRLETGKKKWSAERVQKAADVLGAPVSLLQDTSIPQDRVVMIAQIMEQLSGLSDERLETIARMLEALAS